jgi:phage terminase large subunit
MSSANPNYTFLKKRVPKQRVTLLQGGTRSGKTFSVIYYLIDFCTRYKGAGIEIDLVRDTFTALKATAWKDFKTVLIEHGLYNAVSHNKTDHVYELCGNFISYYGADNPHKIHGRARDILWINEAHQFPKDTVDQLLPRTRHRIICDYNPAIGLGHWLDDLIEQYPPLITTYRDNPHLTKSQIEEIENRRHQKYWWKVYGTGHRAAREGVVFENWETGDFDNSLPYCYGLDFGYAPDPTAMVKVAVDKRRRKIYVRQCLYETELSIGDLINQVKTAVARPRDLIVSDTNEKRTVAAMMAARLNVVRTVKFDGSVIEGIRAMQDYKIVVEPGSVDLVKELNNYIWNQKKSSVPVDDFNHLIDAMRYAFQRLQMPKRSGVMRRN